MITRRTLLQAAAANLPFNRTIRVAIIGTEGHVGVITRPIPGVKLVAATGANAAAVAKLPVERRYATWRELLDRERDIDVVAVTNNNGERAEAIIACAERKKHVIAEKPLSLTRAELARVKKAVDSSGISLGMLLTMRYERAYLIMKDFMASGELGDVLHITSQKSYKLGTRAEWFKDRKTYGGTIAWIGIHMIDLMRHVSGREFREAMSYQARLGFPQVGDMETVTMSIFKLDNGGLAELNMDYLRPESAPSHGDDRLRIAGTKGILEYQASTGVTLVTSSRKPTVLTKVPAHRELFSDFLQATFNGAKPAITPEDAYRVTEITIAAQESADLGRPIKV